MIPPREGDKVTLDAIHTQQETAQIIVQERGADYLLTVKGNQPGIADTLARQGASRRLSAARPKPCQCWTQPVIGVEFYSHGGDGHNMREGGAGITQAAPLGVLAGLAILGSGCANYGTLDVRVQVPPDPPTGQFVSIVRVTDQREFKRPRFSSAVPTLPGRDITNATIRSRAVSWKPSRHPFQGNGNFLLPEGRTVEDVVREAMTRSFRESGYRVATPAEATQTGAVPIEADVRQFYCGLRNLVGTYSLLFDCEVTITGQIPPFEKGKTVLGHVALHSQAVGPKRPWMHTINTGMEAFARETRGRLTAARPPAKAATPGDTTAARLKALEQLRKDNVITEDEYQRRRKAIIDGI